MKQPTKRFLRAELARLINENAELKRNADVTKKQELALAPNPKIQEIEALLRNEEDVPIHILPNGEIRAYTPSEQLNQELEKRKPVTLKEDLGGEYGMAA